MNAPRPGEVYWLRADAGPRHRAIVVSREEFNRGAYVITVTTTSKAFELRSKLPNCVPFRAGERGFTRDCVVQAETIGFIERSALDEDAGPIERLDDEAMRDIIRAIGYVLGAECEPE